MYATPRFLPIPGSVGNSRPDASTLVSRDVVVMGLAVRPGPGLVRVVAVPDSVPADLPVLVARLCVFFCSASRLLYIACSCIVKMSEWMT